MRSTFICPPSALGKVVTSGVRENQSKGFTARRRRGRVGQGGQGRLRHCLFHLSGIAFFILEDRTNYSGWWVEGAI